MRTSAVLKAILWVSLASACGDETSQVELEPYPTYCFGFIGAYPCWESEGGESYDSIAGFNFEWGYRTRLTIATHHVKHPLADASSIEYRLVKVESRTAVEPGTRFDFPIHPAVREDTYPALIDGDCGDGFKLFPNSAQAKALMFDSQAACEAYEQLVASRLPSSLTFEFGAPDAPLRVVDFE